MPSSRSWNSRATSSNRFSRTSSPWRQRDAVRMVSFDSAARRSISPYRLRQDKKSKERAHKRRQNLVSKHSNRPLPLEGRVAMPCGRNLRASETKMYFVVTPGVRVRVVQGQRKSQHNADTPRASMRNNKRTRWRGVMERTRKLESSDLEKKRRLYSREAVGRGEKKKTAPDISTKPTTAMIRATGVYNYPPHRFSPGLDELPGLLLDHGHVRLQARGAEAVGHMLHLLISLLGLGGVHHVITEHGLRVSGVDLVLTHSLVL